jgi:hypothetical protein
MARMRHNKTADVISHRARCLALALAFIFCCHGAHALVVAPASNDGKPAMTPSEVKTALGMKPISTSTQTDTATAPTPAKRVAPAASPGSSEILAMRSAPRVKDELQTVTAKVDATESTESREIMAIYVLVGFALAGLAAVLTVRFISVRANRDRYERPTGPSKYDD